VASSSLGGTPSPRVGQEPEGLPKRVRSEVFSAPEPHGPTPRWPCGSVVDEVNEETPVKDETGVGAHPDLEDAAFALRVDAEEEETNTVRVASESDQATLCMCFLVGLKGKETN